MCIERLAITKSLRRCGDPYTYIVVGNIYVIWYIYMSEHYSYLQIRYG